jgi:hypothetical protein
MRKSLTLAALTATLAIAGCNRPPLQAPQQVSCNCPAQTGGEQLTRFAPPPMAHRHHAHYYGYRTYRNHNSGDESYAQESNDSDMDVSSYDYQSHSTVTESDDSDYSSGVRVRAYASSGGSTYADSDNGAYTNDNNGAYTGDAAHYEADDRWQDGYGRYHNRAHLGPKAIRKRLDPWHGYNRDWDNGY